MLWSIPLSLALATGAAAHISAFANGMYCKVSSLLTPYYQKPKALLSFVCQSSQFCHITGRFKPLKLQPQRQRSRPPPLHAAQEQMVDAGCQQM